jgi:hypothetical protein
MLCTSTNGMFTILENLTGFEHRKNALRFWE